MSIMSAINLGVGCCIPGVVCTLSSWKTAEFSNTTHFHCCINGSSADQCYICIFSLAQITSVGVVQTFEHTSPILILGLLHKTIPAGPGIKSFSKLSFGLHHHIGFKRIYTNARCLTLQKYFSHHSFSY
jgi:hypothetical protein